MLYARVQSIYTKTSKMQATKDKPLVLPHMPPARKCVLSSQAAPKQLPTQYLVLLLAFNYHN